MRTTQRETSELVRRRMAVLTSGQEVAPPPVLHAADGADGAAAAGADGAVWRTSPAGPTDTTMWAETAPDEAPAVTAPAVMAPPTPAAPSVPVAERRGPALSTRLRLAFRERFDLDRRALAGLGVLLLLASGY